MKDQCKWDQNSEEWKQREEELAKPLFGGTEEQWKVWVKEIIRPFADRFWEPGCPAPQIKNFKADIKMKPDGKPVVKRPYKLSPFDETWLAYRILEYQETGQLVTVDPKDAGDRASPVFMVDKVGDILGRLVCDYTGPNRETEDHPGIPPDAENVLRNAVGKDYQTLMDEVWGFSQMELSDRAAEILQVCTPLGLMRWRNFPFGPKQGPGICQQFNDFAFQGLGDTNIYVDDFHTANRTFEEHVEAVKKLLERGREHGVQWRISKCRFCQKEVTLVGFNVSSKGKTPDPEKVRPLKKWPEPKCIADLTSMFAFANYLRDFIPRFVEITDPLKQYRKKGASFDCYKDDDKAQRAVKNLRQAVATKTPLLNPDFEAASSYVETGRPSCLFIDASDFGYGACLCQGQEVHGTLRPIAVLSKSFNSAQQRWTPMEREMHAMFESATWSQKYAKEFKVFLFTDHKNNTFRTKVEPTRRVTKKLLKMVIEMEPTAVFHHKICIIPGTPKSAPGKI